MSSPLLISSILLLLLLLPLGSSRDPSTCSKDNVLVSIGSSKTNHRDFIVSFTNANKFNISDIRVTCSENYDIYMKSLVGTTLPVVFRKVGPKECLLLNGDVLLPGNGVAFPYDNYWWVFKKVFHFEIIKIKCHKMGT